MGHFQHVHACGELTKTAQDSAAPSLPTAGRASQPQDRAVTYMHAIPLMPTTGASSSSTQAWTTTCSAWTALYARSLTRAVKATVTITTGVAARTATVGGCGAPKITRSCVRVPAAVVSTAAPPEEVAREARRARGGTDLGSATAQSSPPATALRSPAPAALSKADDSVKSALKMK